MRRQFRISLRRDLLIFLFLLILILVKIFGPGKFSVSHSEFQEPLETILKKSRTSINDTLPHYAYKKKEDSLRAIVIRENRLNSRGTGWGLLSFGTSKTEGELKEENHFFINDYRVPQGSFFFSKDGKNYLSYSDWDREIFDSAINTSLRMHHNAYENDWSVFYPVSKNALIAWNVIIIIFMILFGVALFYVLLVIPMRVLLLIAKGNAFNDENIGNLHFMAYTLITIGLVSTILPVLLHFYFKNLLPSVVRFSFYDALMNGWGFLISGLILLLLAKAFLRGYKLQKDQELTV